MFFFPSAGVTRHILSLVLWLVKAGGMSLKYEVFFSFSYLICTKTFIHLSKKVESLRKIGIFIMSIVLIMKRGRHRFCLMLRPVLEVRWRFSLLCCSYRESKLNAIWKNWISYENRKKKDLYLKSGLLLKYTVIKLFIYFLIRTLY